MQSVCFEGTSVFFEVRGHKWIYRCLQHRYVLCRLQNRSYLFFFLIFSDSESQEVLSMRYVASIRYNWHQVLKHFSSVGGSQPPDPFLAGPEESLTWSGCTGTAGPLQLASLPNQARLVELLLNQHPSFHHQSFSGLLSIHSSSSLCLCFLIIWFTVMHAWVRDCGQASCSKSPNL